MPRSRRATSRLLNREEADLVDRTSLPALSTIGSAELPSLRNLLRERRNRARGIAARQRRELRGKSEPRGAAPARDDAGSVGKYEVLTAALKRVGKEIRRRREPTSSRLSTSMRRAMSLKNAGQTYSTKPDDRTASEGMRSLPDGTVAPSGAFDHVGMQPAMQRSKFAR